MKTIKTSLRFGDGKIIETEKYAHEFSPDATNVESVKFFLRYFIATNELSGKIEIESRDGKFYIGYDVKPEKYLELVKAELGGRFKIIENS